MSLRGVSPALETGGVFASSGALAGVGEAPAGATVIAQTRDLIGRPSKYDPAFCQQVIALCSTGASLASFAASIGVARRTLRNWADDHADFAEALAVAKACACAWWEERARKIGDGDGGPGAAAMVQFMLKNFGTEDFSDRREVAYSGAVNHNLLTHAEAVEEARRRGLPERVLIADNADDAQ